MMKSFSTIIVEALQDPTLVRSLGNRYAQQAYDLAVLAMASGESPRQIRELGREAFLYHFESQVFDGLWTKEFAGEMGNTVQHAINQAIHEYNPDQRSFCEEALKAKRYMLFRGVIEDTIRGDERRLADSKCAALLDLLIRSLTRGDARREAVVQRLREVVFDTHLSPAQIADILLGFASDPGRYEAHAAQGLDDAEYVRREAELFGEYIKPRTKPLGEEGLHDNESGDLQRSREMIPFAQDDWCSRQPPRRHT
jgi:hypothetical protein